MSRQAPYRGGSNRHIQSGSSTAYSPVQHDIDLAMAQAAYPILLKRAQAMRIQTGEGPRGSAHYVSSAVKDLLRQLARGPYQTMSEKQRSMVEKVLGGETVAAIRARFVVRETETPRPPMPKPPPFPGRKKDEDE